jgi:hypothetical protein
MEDDVAKNYSKIKLDPFDMVTCFRGWGDSYAKIAKAFYYPNDKAKRVTAAELKAWHKAHSKSKAIQKKEGSRE